MEGEKIEIATLDVRNYRPEEISLKVEYGKIKVDGKHRSEGEFGFETSEFHRTYNLPTGIDASSVTSRISGEGVLHVEAVKSAAQETEVALVGCSSGSAGDVAKIDEKQFTVTLDVSNFAPEEIVVKVYGNELSVRARRESEEHGHFTSRQFNRHFVLPKDVDMDSLVSRLGKDGKLHIEADRKIPPAPHERQINISRDAE